MSSIFPCRYLILKIHILEAKFEFKRTTSNRGINGNINFRAVMLLETVILSMWKLRPRKAKSFAKVTSVSDAGL